jgi:hypothetical protein
MSSSRSFIRSRAAFRASSGARPALQTPWLRKAPFSRELMPKAGALNQSESGRSPRGDANSKTPVCPNCAWRSHARRKFWEAAVAKQPAAREELVRINTIFEIDERCRKGNPPSKIKALRQKHLSPLVHEFLEFASASYEACKDQRGSMRSAFGYTVRQSVALARFLEDGRLRLDNNPSESAAQGRHDS